GEFERTEVLDQVAKHGVREAVLVSPLRIPEDAIEFVGVRGLNGTRGGLDCSANVIGDPPNLAPVSFARNLEAVVLRVSGELGIAAGLSERSLRFLIKDVAEALVKQKRKNELLVVAGVDGAPQEHGGAPEIR